MTFFTGVCFIPTRMTFTVRRRRDSDKKKNSNNSKRTILAIVAEKWVLIQGFLRAELHDR